MVECRCFICNLKNGKDGYDILEISPERIMVGSRWDKMKENMKSGDQNEMAIFNERDETVYFPVRRPHPYQKGDIVLLELNLTLLKSSMDKATYHE